MHSLMARLSASFSGTPMRNSMPSSSAKVLPAFSIRVTDPSASKQIRRAPTSIAVRATISPSTHSAILEVPPPTSTFITGTAALFDKATAPEPCATSAVSRLSPALTATNFPAWSANRSAIARALRRRTATPVSIRAPASTSSKCIPAFLYCASRNGCKLSASIVSSSRYGVSMTSDSASTSREVTT